MPLMTLLEAVRPVVMMAVMMAAAVLAVLVVVSRFDQMLAMYLYKTYITFVAHVRARVCMCVYQQQLSG